MARLKKSDPHKYASYSLPVSLIERLQDFCMDPLLGKPRNGMQSEIVGMLIKGFLDKQEALKKPAESAVSTAEIDALLTPTQENL